MEPILPDILAAPTYPRDGNFQFFQRLPHDICASIFAYLGIDDAINFYYTGDTHIHELARHCTTFVRQYGSSQLALYHKHMDMMQLETLECQFSDHDILCRRLQQQQHAFLYKNNNTSFNTVHLLLAVPQSLTILTQILGEQLMPRLQSLILHGPYNHASCKFSIDLLQAILPSHVTKLHLQHYIFGLTFREETYGTKDDVAHICFPHVQNLTIVHCCRDDDARSTRIIFGLSTTTRRFAFHQYARHHIATYLEIDFDTIHPTVQCLDLQASYVFRDRRIAPFLPRNLKLAATIQKLIISECQMSHIAQYPTRIESLTICKTMLFSHVPILHMPWRHSDTLPSTLTHLDIDSSIPLHVYAVSYFPSTLRSLRVPLVIQYHAQYDIYQGELQRTLWSWPVHLESLELVSVKYDAGGASTITPYAHAQLEFLRIVLLLPCLHTCRNLQIHVPEIHVVSSGLRVLSLCYPHPLDQSPNTPSTHDHIHHIIVNLSQCPHLQSLGLTLRDRQHNIALPQSLTSLNVAYHHDDTMKYLYTNTHCDTIWPTILTSLVHLTSLSIQTRSDEEAMHIIRILPNLPLNTLVFQHYKLDHTEFRFTAFDGQLPPGLLVFAFQTLHKRACVLPGNGRAVSLPPTLQTLILHQPITSNALPHALRQWHRTYYPSIAHFHIVHQLCLLSCTTCIHNTWIRSCMERHHAYVSKMSK